MTAEILTLDKSLPNGGDFRLRALSWSQNRQGIWNGKVGPLTLFTVAFYPPRGWFVAPKLPGLNKTIPVSSAKAGQKRAEALYRRYVQFLLGTRREI